MKRIISIGVFLLFLSGTVTAQRNFYPLRERQTLRSGMERLQWQRDYFRLNLMQRQAVRDGRLHMGERRALRKRKPKSGRGPSASVAMSMAD